MNDEMDIVSVDVSIDIPYRIIRKGFDMYGWSGDSVLISSLLDCDSYVSDVVIGHSSSSVVLSFKNIEDMNDNLTETIKKVREVICEWAKENT